MDVDIDVDVLTVAAVGIVGLSGAAKTVQKMRHKNERKMVIFAKGSAWFDFSKMIIFDSFFISFSKFIFEKWKENEN